MATIKTHPVKSSNIAELGYDEATFTLRVVFQRGKSIWEYTPVSPEDYKALQEAESIGAYFAKNIRNNTAITATKQS